MIWLTAAIAFFALCTVGAGLLQWNAMKGQLGEIQKQYPELQKAALAARDSADVARDTLIASNRPWMNVEAHVYGSLMFTKDGAYIPITFKSTNIGHSPAMNVWTSAELYLPQNPERDTEAERVRLCNTLTKPLAINAGVTVFPNTDTGLGSFNGNATNDAIKYATAYVKNFLLPTVIACVAYQSTIEKKDVWHTTSIVYDLWKPGQQGTRSAISLSEDVPAYNLRLTLSPFHGVMAN